MISPRKHARHGVLATACGTRERADFDRPSA